MSLTQTINFVTFSSNLFALKYSSTFLVWTRTRYFQRYEKYQKYFLNLSVQAQRRSKEHSRSTSAMSGLGDEKSELSETVDHHMSLYSNGFPTPTIGTYT